MADAIPYGYYQNGDGRVTIAPTFNTPAGYNQIDYNTWKSALQPGQMQNWINSASGKDASGNAVTDQGLLDAINGKTGMSQYSNNNGTMVQNDVLNTSPQQAAQNSQVLGARQSGTALDPNSVSQSGPAPARPPTGGDPMAPGGMSAQTTDTQSANLPPAGLQMPPGFSASNGPARPTGQQGGTGNAALDSVYGNRTDLQQLYNPDGSAKNPNDPRIAGIPTLNDWMNQYGINEEPSLQGQQGQNTQSGSQTPPGGANSAPGRASPGVNTGYQQALSQVQSLAVPTQAELDLQSKIDALDASSTAGQNAQMSNTGNPIPYSVKSGYAKDIQDQVNAQTATLTQQLARLQAQRQAQLTAAQATFEANKPVANNMYGLVDPMTGQQMGGLSGSGLGGNAQQILAYLSANGIDPTRYSLPGLIAAVQNGATAADIISGRANVAAVKVGAEATAGNKSQLLFDKNGNPINYTPTVTGASPSSSSSAPAPVSSSGGSSNIQFTLASDGKTVLANGTPVDLTTFQQMTGQTGKSLQQTNFAMVNKSGTQGVQRPASTGIQPRGPSSGFVGPINPNQSGGGLQGSAKQYFLSGDINATGLGSSNSINALNNQVAQYAQSLGINNWSASKVKALNSADAANYAQTVQKLTDTTTALSNADNSFKQILQAYPSLNNASSPLWNKTANEIASNLTGGQRIAFQGAMTELGNEYAQVFSRGGVTTVNSHVSAAGVIDPSISMKDLKDLATQLQSTGKIIVNGWANDVNNIMSGIGPKNQTGQGGGANQTPPDINSLRSKYGY